MILAHSLSIGKKRLAKGRHLEPGDILAARHAGLTELVVAALEAGDVPEDDAAAAVAVALCGAGLVAETPVHGRVNLVAAGDGILIVGSAAVDALNAVDEAAVLGTLPAFTRVRAGDIVATIKIIPFAAPEATVGRCADLAAASPLWLAGFEPQRVLLIQTMLAGTSEKMLVKTAGVTHARCAALGLAAWAEQRVAHDEAALAAVLATCDDADIVLVAGASAISDRRDVVPAAIVSAGGAIVRLGMPVDPGNLLCLGHIGGAHVIGLPGCARSPKYNGFDRVLERLFAGLEVTSADIAAMGVGGLLADVPRPEPRPTPHAAKHKVGAVVLAAGRSVRMGANKLLAALGDRPVLAHVLGAVRAAGIDSIVVTGHQADAVAALASEFGGRVVHAARYAEGLSQSLAAGIRAAPADWTAAIILLGDMPGVKASHIREIAAAARSDAIVVPVFSGKRGNPVVWGSRYFSRLAQIEGDVGGKALLAEFDADVTEIVIGDDGILIDVDTPEALAAARARYAS